MNDLIVCPHCDSEVALKIGDNYGEFYYVWCCKCVHAGPEFALPEDAVNHWNTRPRETKLIAKMKHLENIKSLALELITSRLVNRGVDRDLVVVEFDDKSDPHYKLCETLDNDN